MIRKGILEFLGNKILIGNNKKDKKINPTKKKKKKNVSGG